MVNDDLSRLVESPTSLNLPKSRSTKTIYKTAVKDQLIENISEIRQPEIRNALSLMRYGEYSYLLFLFKIEPCFPRFLSELYKSSYFGYGDSLIGLIQSSKTMRRVFSPKCEDKLFLNMLVSELNNYYNLMYKDLRKNLISTWECSTVKSDDLRTESWNRKIIGKTVPHPIECLGRPSIATNCTV